MRLCGFEDAQHDHGSAEGEQSAASGGNVLVVAEAEAEKVAELIVASAEPGGRSGGALACRVRCGWREGSCRGRRW